MKTEEIQLMLLNANRLLSAHHSQYRFNLNQDGCVEVILDGTVIESIPPEKVHEELTNLVAVECQSHM